MNFDENFINHYYNNMSHSRQNIYTDAFYRMLDCQTKEELELKINTMNLTIIKK